jgi:hypothetical protein
MAIETLIERARRYIARCQAAISGQGGHNATFRVAAILWNGFGLSEADALMLLREYNQRCVPPWSESELIHKVKAVANVAHAKPRGHLVNEEGEVPGPEARDTGRRDAYLTPPPKPVFCPMVLKRVAAKLDGVADMCAFLAGCSPVPVDKQDSASMLRWLYPKGSAEKVLIFSNMKSQGQMLWEADKGDRLPNSGLPAGPDGVWFLPQPTDGVFHPNPRLNGKPSRRSEESVTSWRYAVLESDEADIDEWLRCLTQMPLRIACICESGRRSVHSLVQVDAASKADWDRMVGSIKPVLITLGADRAALSAVRLTRLPQARRGEWVQRLLYLNASPDGTPIIQMRNGGSHHE